MNCGCLPGFPGENHKQLLNAIVHWEGLVGGDFETFQKRAWEIAKGSNKAFDSRIWWVVVLLTLFGERFLFLSLHLPCSKSGVVAVPGDWGLACL